MRKALSAFLATVALGGACAGAGDSDRAPADASLDQMLANAPRVPLVEELRLDAEAEDFSSIRNIYVAPDRDIVVPLRQDGQVLIYAPDGTLETRFGRRGSGPGEFESLGTIGWLADTMWVHDSALRRTTFVAPDGALLRTQPLGLSMPMPLRGPADDTIAGGLSSFSPLAYFPDGSMMGAAQVWEGDRSGMPSFMIALARPGADARLLVRPPALDDPRWMLDVDGMVMPIPFTMLPSVQASADGHRFANMFAELTAPDGGTVTLTVHDWSAIASGAAASALPGPRTRTYSFRGEPIPQAVRDSALATFGSGPRPRAEPGAEASTDPAQRVQALARERTPAVYTPVTAFRLGLDDTMWLILRPTEEGTPVLALDGNGAPLVFALLPPRAVLRQAAATHVWVTQADEFGLNSVVRYRLER